MSAHKSPFHARPLVYVAGPYTKPDPCITTHDAIETANSIVDVCVPLIPHLSHFWHTMTPQPYEFWTDLDFVYLSRCDAMLRIPGDSLGADAEEVAAHEWGIPVFHNEQLLRLWIRERWPAA